ncbi:unnamed protein product [Hydatigera taeniaeformis]|uniref:Glypican-1 n=1 Tax=Hydatigena taeniaeformis TaxID=6205 RepID=A0A0R3X7D7_HYDTA|nr:unnamed protein product [Hydatigera taeniaeformis]
MNYLQASIKNVLLELKLISATYLTRLNPELQHCLSNDAEILNLLEIVKPDAIDISAYRIQDDLENNLVKYLDHFSFFIEILSTIKQQKLSESCAAGFEQLFFCRLCQSQNSSSQNYNKDVPQVINLIGPPCPHRCLNVIRGCYASLTGVLPQLSQLSKDFIDLSRLLAQITSKTPDTGGAFLHNHFLDEMREWSKKLESLPLAQWTSIREKVKQRCTGNPPVEVINPASSEWKVEVAEFLWPATERALRTSTVTPPLDSENLTTGTMWPLLPAGGRESSDDSKGSIDLRSEQQRSYLRMEQLIEQFMVPERLFGEHLGQPCLLGSKHNCWNGHEFADEYEGLADFTQSGQLKNPAVKVTLAEAETAAARLGPKITARSQATMKDRSCPPDCLLFCLLFRNGSPTAEGTYLHRSPNTATVMTLDVQQRASERRSGGDYGAGKQKGKKEVEAALIGFSLPSSILCLGKRISKGFTKSSLVPLPLLPKSGHRRRPKASFPYQNHPQPIKRIGASKSVHILNGFTPLHGSSIERAIRALVHKIRRRSSGEIVEEGLPPPLPQMPDEEEEQSLNFHSLGPVIDIDEETALPANYNGVEESSGLPFGYVDKWNSLLPPQGPPKGEGDYTFGGVDDRSNIIADLEEELDVTAIPTTAGCGIGQLAAWLAFVLALFTGKKSPTCHFLQYHFSNLLT